MEGKDRIKILFIINPFSGENRNNWAEIINYYFKDSETTIEIFLLDKNLNAQDILNKLELLKPEKVVAVGGDGTVNLVAECALQKNIPLGILPAGSANGLAKELGISEYPEMALNTINSGRRKKIHILNINGKLCLHLSDIGLNAWMIKIFQAENVRGIWGYFKANLKLTWEIFFVKPIFEVVMTLDHEKIKTNAVMIVFANATTYGTGAVINPAGNLEDDVFEVILIKKISVPEVFKMLISHASFNPHKTEVLQAKNLKIHLSKKIHFQIDGEYLGKTEKIEAYIIPAAIEILVP